MSAKLCCVAQACCLSTWVAQVGGSGASHKKACLTLKHFSRYLFTIAALFPYPSQALSRYCPQTPISSCHFPAPNSPPSTSTARQPDSGLASPGWAHPSLRNLGTYSPSSAPMYNPRLKSYPAPHKRAPSPFTLPQPLPHTFLEELVLPNPQQICLNLVLLIGFW